MRASESLGFTGPARCWSFVVVASAAAAFDCVFFVLFLFFVLSGPVFVEEGAKEGEEEEEEEEEEDEDDDDDRPAFAPEEFNKWFDLLCWMTARSKACTASWGVSYVPTWVGFPSFFSMLL